MIIERGRYDRWQIGRLIIREGHQPVYFFIILDGEVEVFGRNKDAYKAAYELRKEEIENSPDKKTKLRILSDLDRTHIRIFGAMASGGTSQIQYFPRAN